MLSAYYEINGFRALTATRKIISHELTGRRYDTGLKREQEALTATTAGTSEICDMQKGIAQDMGFLTEDDVAHLFKVAKPTLENWRRHGTGPAYAYAGNCFFYPVEGISNFLMARVKGFGFDKVGAA